jgi:hypothetical protein
MHRHVTWLFGVVTIAFVVWACDSAPAGPDSLSRFAGDSSIESADDETTIRARMLTRTRPTT